MYLHLLVVVNMFKVIRWVLLLAASKIFYVLHESKQRVLDGYGIAVLPQWQFPEWTTALLEKNCIVVLLWVLKQIWIVFECVDKKIKRKMFHLSPRKALKTWNCMQYVHQQYRLYKSAQTGSQRQRMCKSIWNFVLYCATSNGKILILISMKLRYFKMM